MREPGAAPAVRPRAGIVLDGVHLVGSMQGSGADEVFETVGRTLGPWIRRVSDGEIGPGRRWLFQEWSLYRDSPDFDVLPPAPESLFPRVALRDGVDPSAVRMGSLNYAANAAESYAVFRRRKADGTLPAHTRFLVSFPTPCASLMVLVDERSRAAVAPLHDRHLREGIERILEVVPPEELAVCWDVREAEAWEHGVLPWGGGSVTRDELLGGLLTAAGWLPEPVELGFHLCYGDQNARIDRALATLRPEGFELDGDLTSTDRMLPARIFPAYLGVLAELTTELFARCPRRVDFVHLPTVHAVEQIDAAAYRPLAALRVPDHAEVYLGVVDLDGGIDATRRHIEAAASVLPRFGISPECGIGRVSPAEFRFTLDALRGLAEERAPR